MPPHVSFSKTTDSVLRHEKDVTRRMGWKHLKPGQSFVGVERAMGLKKGQKHVALADCRCVSNVPEPLSVLLDPANRAYALEEMRREGFPSSTPEQFVAFFCSFNRCSPDDAPNRIEFEYVD